MIESKTVALSQNTFFETTPKQTQFCDAAFSGLYTYLAYGGGIRSGKSAVAIILAQTLARIYPRSRWAIVRKDLPTLRRNVLPTFEKLRVKGFCGEVNKSDWIAPCKNGSEIVFFTESASEDPELNRWRGLEVNGFFLEEANELLEKSWRKAIERAGSWVVPDGGEQPPPFIILTFNPSAGWVKREFYDKWKAGALKNPFYYLPATILDNPYIPQAYKDSLANLPEREYKLYVEGDWQFISGAFFTELGADTHLTPAKKHAEHGWQFLPPHWTYWGSYDWGFRHPAVFQAFAKDTDGQVYVLDTLKMHRLEDIEQAALIKERMPPQCLKVVYAGHDAFNKRQAHSANVASVEDVFMSYGIGLDRANIARVQGWAQVGRMLTRKQFDGSQGTPKLLFCDTLGNKWAIARMLELTPDPTNTEDALKIDASDDGEGGDDAADCLRYGLASPGHLPVKPQPAIVESSDRDVEFEKMAQEYAKKARFGTPVEMRPSGPDGQADLSNW